jgi:hypothetical protein
MDTTTADISMVSSQRVLERDRASAVLQRCKRQLGTPYINWRGGAV